MKCRHQVVQKTKDGFYYVRPCGQCKECRINDTRSWYVRSRFELKKKERPFHYFLTLTYNDESLPEDGFCSKEHLKKFLNNLNTSFSLYMRYYACSDYGSINNRAHYHAILCTTVKLRQAQVERIWKKGFVYLKTLNDKNLKYVLRYTVKKQPVDWNSKAFFRFISKGWGNNVAEYYAPGMEYFVFDGKKYGINSYLRQKLGLDKKPVDKTKYLDRLILSPQYQYVGSDDKEAFDEFNNSLQIYRRRLK